MSAGLRIYFNIIKQILIQYDGDQNNILGSQ